MNFKQLYESGKLEPFMIKEAERIVREIDERFILELNLLDNYQEKLTLSKRYISNIKSRILDLNLTSLTSSYRLKNDPNGYDQLIPFNKRINYFTRLGIQELADNYTYVGIVTIQYEKYQDQHRKSKTELPISFFWDSLESYHMPIVKNIDVVMNKEKELSEKLLIYSSDPNISKLSRTELLSYRDYSPFVDHVFNICECLGNLQMLTRIKQTQEYIEEKIDSLNDTRPIPPGFIYFSANVFNNDKLINVYDYFIEMVHKDWIGHDELETFIYQAFCNEENSTKDKLRIRGNFRREDVISFFYEYYFLNKNFGNLKQADYINLLCDNFEGFVFSTTKNNFRNK